MCIIYFFSGLTKCLGSGWWDGSNLWRALIRPPFNIIDPEILIRWKYLFPVAGIFICLLEIGYPFLIWNSKTRKIWLIGICAMHVGIGLTVGMYLFAFVMIILNVAAFGPGLILTQLRTYQPATVETANESAGKEHSFGRGFLSSRMPICPRQPRTVAVRIRSTRG